MILAIPTSGELSLHLRQFLPCLNLFIPEVVGSDSGINIIYNFDGFEKVFTYSHFPSYYHFKERSL